MILAAQLIKSAQKAQRDSKGSRSLLNPSAIRQLCASQHSRCHRGPLHYAWVTSDHDRPGPLCRDRDGLRGVALGQLGAVLEDMWLRCAIPQPHP